MGNGAGRRTRRDLSLTPELVALCQRPEIDPGPDGRWTKLSEADFVRVARDLDAGIGEGPLWVFAYGSLIWKPAFEASEARRASVFGWHRAFCLEMTRWRGSREQPGLMMALERGGRCDGVAYRFPDGDRPAQIERLLRREISEHESIGAVRWLPATTAAGPLKALGFWVGIKGPGTALAQPLDKVAHVLARACGHIGSCAEYLYNTVLHLEEFGIHDRNLWRLQQLVAAEIMAIHGRRESSGQQASADQGSIASRQSRAPSRPRPAGRNCN